jgi:hypothetical protein
MTKNVVPSADLVDGLGVSGKAWKWLYAGEVHIGENIVLKEIDGELALSVDNGSVFNAVMPSFDYVSYLDMGVIAAADYTSVLSSGFNSNSATGTLTATFDVPRNLQVSYPMGWDGGEVTIVGTDAYGNAASESYFVSVSAPQVGEIAFKTITGISKVSVGTDSANLEIGVGNKFGTGQYHTDPNATVFSTGSSPISVSPVDLVNGTVEVEVDGVSRYTIISKVQYTPNIL